MLYNFSLTTTEVIEWVIDYISWFYMEENISGLVWGCSNSSALAMGFLQSWAKPLICIYFLMSLLL